MVSSQAAYRPYSVVTEAPLSSAIQSLVVDAETPWPQIGIVLADLDPAIYRRKLDNAPPGAMFFGLFELLTILYGPPNARKWPMGIRKASVWFDPRRMNSSGRSYSLSLVPEPDNWSILIQTDDSSTAVVSFPQGSGDLDSGHRLLEPITAPEFSGIEGVLSWLQDQIQHDQLSQQDKQILVQLADEIRTAARQVEPGKTARWRIIGLIGHGVVYLFEKLPAGVLRWIELSDRLQSMGWLETAKAVSTFK